MDISQHIGCMKIEVVIRLRNVLEKCIIKISNFNISPMFVYILRNVSRRFAYLVQFSLCKEYIYIYIYIYMYMFVFFV